MSARPYRLLALVKQDAVVRVQKEPDDTVMTWPHLLTIEFLAAGMMSIFLLLMGLFINAPLEELANGNVTPAVAKAPWYFLGLQELLAYFHPTVAGVLVPTFVLVGAALHPVRRPRQHPRHPALPAQDRGHAVHDVLRPRPRRHVRRDLLPRPRLHLRHPVRDEPGPPLRPLTGRGRPADEQLPRRAVDKPAALTSEAIKSLRKEQVQGLSRRQLLRGSIGAGLGLWLLELTGRHRRVPLAEPAPAASAAPIPIGTLDDVKPAELHPADRGGLPGPLRQRARLRHARGPGPAAVHPGRGHDRRRHRRSTCAPSTSAARTWAASRIRACELLARMPVPRLALRPARHQGRRRPVRAGAARHGPVLGHGRRRRAS